MSNSNFKNILSPFTFPISKIKLNSRTVMAPMTTYSGNDDGTVSEDEIIYYKKRNKSADLLISACAYVTKEGKGFHGQIGADTDEMIPSLKRIADALKENGGKAVLQIYHGGRMSSPAELKNGQSISASAIASIRESAQIPREMIEKEITQTIKAFGESTRRAIEAGFDGVEIHGANTYLLQQFFSPHSNRRTDKWGGNLAKRMRFPLEVIDAVKIAIKENAKNPFLIGYRISPEEIENPGITIEDTLELVEAISNKKLDYLHVSTMDFWGGSVRDKNDTIPRTQLIFDKVKNTTPVIAVGGISTPEDAEKILKTDIPLIAFGRELLIEPHWLEKVKNETAELIETSLDVKNQLGLLIPIPMWNSLLTRTGWITLKK